MTSFVAIDFETATAHRDSACAVGLAACYGGRVVLSRTYLIRPPRPQFTFTRVHGLGWKDVKDAPDFAELWPVLRTWIGGAAFLAAHNARFDRGVLNACCSRYRLRPPRTSFTCTVQLARAQWGIHPTSLPEVCRWLCIPLRHHDAGADALACAQVVLAAHAAGWRWGRRRKRLTRRVSARATARTAFQHRWTMNPTMPCTVLDDLARITVSRSGRRRELPRSELRRGAPTSDDKPSVDDSN